MRKWFALFSSEEVFWRGMYFAALAMLISLGTLVVTEVPTQWVVTQSWVPPLNIDRPMW